MILRDMALTGNEGQRYDVDFDNEFHELTRDEILANDDYGTQGVVRWFPSESEPGMIVVTCNGNFTDMDFMTASQAAEALGVSRMRVNQLIHDGKLAAKMVGSMWAVDKASVEARKNGA